MALTNQDVQQEIPVATPFAKAPTPEEIKEETPAPRYDGKNRYLIPNPDDPRKTLHLTRATNFAKIISDTGGLEKWAKRMVVQGMAQRPDLFARAGRTPSNDWHNNRAFDTIASEAMQAAGAWDRAKYGTTLHSLTERVDRGDLDPTALGPPWGAIVRAYAQILRDTRIQILPEYIERTVIVKQFKIAGTFDRVVEMPNGELWISDQKGLALDTSLPTPTGWTTMDKVQEGDQVLGADGHPTMVTSKSQVKRIGTYVVRFDDGSEIVCDGEHRWQTSLGWSHQTKTTVKSIEEIYGSVHNRQGQTQHRVPVTKPLQLPEVDLPVEPYLLGAWLGDGANRGGVITGVDRELFEFFEQDGHQLGIDRVDPKRPHIMARTVLGLTTKLRVDDLLYNKHIPEAYLRASYSQRLRLLQGLMDTDGSWSKPRRRAQFHSCNQTLVENVEELLLTLGQRPHLMFYRAKGFGLVVDAWKIEFTPNGLNPFRLLRKADQAQASAKNLFKAQRRVIVSVEPGPDVETACIAVDAPDHLYLAGKTMIPTHNSGRDLSYNWGEIAIQLALYAHADAIWDYGLREFLPMPEVSQDKALIIHTPVDESEVALYQINIAHGWAAADLCDRVRNWRKFKGLSELVDKIEVEAPPPVAWEDQIKEAKTVEDLSVIWKEASSLGEWTRELEEMGLDRKLEIEG